MHFKEDIRFQENIAAFDSLNGQEHHTDLSSR